MLRHRLLVIALGSVAAAASVADHCGVFGTLGPDRQRYDRKVAIISNVVDGDTIDLDLPDSGNGTTRVRLLGIDCPELAHGDEKTGALFGREAADFSKTEFLGKRVRLMLDPTTPARDKHGRLLAYLYLADSGPDGISINQQLIDRGLAFADWRFEHVHELRFERSERIAMRAKIGMWKNMAREQLPTWRLEMLEKGQNRAR